MFILIYEYIGKKRRKTAQEQKGKRVSYIVSTANDVLALLFCLLKIFMMGKNIHLVMI